MACVGVGKSGSPEEQADDLHALGAQLAHLAGHGGGGGYLPIAVSGVPP